MNCSYFDSVVFAVARSRLLDVAASEQALTHARICVQCAKRLAEQRALCDGISLVMSGIAATSAPSRVEAALLEAFREHVTRADSPTELPIPISGAGRRIRRQAAVAAGILILISGMALLGQRSSAPSHPEEAIVPKEPSIQDAMPSERRQVIDDEKTTARRPTLRNRPSPRRPSEDEVVTQFFPLLEGHDVDSFEGGQIVRVELPTSALSAVGLPGGVNNADEVVEADVILGHDGLARAIRFVR